MTVTELHGSVADMLGVRSKAWIGAPLLVILSVLVALSIAESFVRLAGIGSDQFLRSDRVLGVRFIPGKRGLSQGICYGAHVSINSHGWRGREVSVSKPPGVYRILVLGDSFMAGLQVENGQTFPSVLEDILTRLNPSQRVEVLNFGVPSWGTDQEYVSLREYGLSFDPNLVLLAFYAQNDVSDNSAELQGTFSAYPKPFFDIEGDRLIERPFEDPAVGPLAVARRLAAPLRLYPLVRDSLLGVPITHRLLYDMGIVGVPPAEEPPVGGQTHNVFRWPERWRNQLGVYRRDYSAAWTRAWDITRRLTLRIRDDAKASGSDFLLVQVPGPVSVMPASLRRDSGPRRRPAGDVGRRQAAP